MALIAGENPPVYSSIKTGRVATGAAAAISATETGCSLIRLTAPSTNTAPVYIGHDATVSATTGVPIEPGTEKFFFVDSLAKLFAFSAAAQSIGFECYR